MVKKRALLVGINYIGTDAELGGCINDVKKVRQMLLGEGFDDRNIVMLTEEEKKPRKPTEWNIVRWLMWLIRLARDGDVLYFHFSGHGSYVRDTSGDERDRRDECLVPLDYLKSGMITDDVIKRIIMQVGKEVNLYMIFDCCHSGTLADLPYKYNENNRVIVNKRNIVPKCNVVMISGCKDSQTSADAWFREEKRYEGALTNTYLRVLKSYDNEVSYKILLGKVRRILKLKEFTQIPQLSFGKIKSLNDKFKL